MNHAATTIEIPQTREGWYVLHDAWYVDWGRWQQADDRDALLAEAQAWMAKAPERGDSAAYRISGQKADLLFLHYRADLAGIDAAKAGLRQLRLMQYLRPAGAFVSMIELGMYEVTAGVRRALAGRGLTPESADWPAVYAAELDRATAALQDRLFRPIPGQRHLCFYPMSKRRGEQRNWYALSSDERRDFMRSHGRVGSQYREQVTQVVSGAIGLDDWEWSVDLHSDDPLVFKKLVTEMRYDPASAWYAEFGPFLLGTRLDSVAL